MKSEDQDWIMYLDDTIRLLSRVSQSSEVGVAADGVLPRTESGYNEEFTIKNESTNPIYFVRGADCRTITIDPTPTNIMHYDTIGAPDVTVYIRQHHVDLQNQKNNSNKAMRYALDSRKLVHLSVYIPELGGFLCSLSQLSRVKNYCGTRYKPVAPDASCPVWIHAHITRSHLTHLYASVNNTIVKVKVHSGETDHARDRIIYYQWSYDPERLTHEILDTIPADHFLKHTRWETKSGQYVTTTYEELKVLMCRRDIDIDYNQTLKDNLALKEKENAYLKSQIIKLADPVMQNDIMTEKAREKLVKTLKDTFDVIDRTTSAAKAGLDIQDKYHSNQRKRADDSFSRLKQVLESGSGVMRILTSAVSLLGSIMKLIG